MGWFPLNRRSSRLMHLAAGDKITGSVQLRVRWVHSIDAFLKCRVEGLQVCNKANASAKRTLIQSLFEGYPSHRRPFTACAFHDSASRSLCTPQNVHCRFMFFPLEMVCVYVSTNSATSTRCFSSLYTLVAPTMCLLRCPSKFHTVQ